MRRALNFLGVRTVRFAVVSIVLITLFLSFICGSVIVKAGNDRAASNERLYYTSIVVNEGDTLWDIAQEYMTEEYDTAHVYIKEVMESNHLESTGIIEGQMLILPYYADKPIR